MNLRNLNTLMLGTRNYTMVGGSNLTGEAYCREWPYVIGEEYQLVPGSRCVGMGKHIRSSGENE